MRPKMRDMSANDSVFPGGAWPMVESALSLPFILQNRPSSGFDEEAFVAARDAEARTRLPRAANGAPPAFDRETARALVDAGYMPLEDYVALYGDDMVASQRAAPAVQEPAMQVTGHFPEAFPRRQTYRATTVRCTFAKPSRRLVQWERRA